MFLKTGDCLLNTLICLTLVFYSCAETLHKIDKTQANSPQQSGSRTVDTRHDEHHQNLRSNHNNITISKNSDSVIEHGKSEIFRESNHNQGGHDSLGNVNYSNQNQNNPQVHSINNNGFEHNSDIHPQQDDGRIPFWNIGHMVNSIATVDEMIRGGVAGIEIDVTFDIVPNRSLENDYLNENDHPIKASAYHGLPCDCFRLCLNKEDFITMIQYIKKITTKPNNKLGVILLDLKITRKDLDETKKSYIGDYLAHTLMNILYKDLSIYGDLPPVRTIISINHVTDHMLIRTFIERVKHQNLGDQMRYIGWDVGMNDAIDNVTSMWNDIDPKRQLNIWQGDGLTNCANYARNNARLKEALAVRNAQGPFRKIYFWTVDVKTQLRGMLRTGIDAVLTNQPERVAEVLKEAEFASKYKLATIHDDPFYQFNIKSMPWKFPRFSEIAETLHNLRNSSHHYFKSLPSQLESAIQKVGHRVSSYINQN